MANNFQDYMALLKEAAENAKKDGTYDEKDDRGLPKWLSAAMNVKRVPLPPPKFFLEKQCELVINPTKSKSYTLRIIAVRKVFSKGTEVFDVSMMSYPIRESVCESHPFYHLSQEQVQTMRMNVKTADEEVDTKKEECDGSDKDNNAKNDIHETKDETQFYDAPKASAVETDCSGQDQEQQVSTTEKKIDDFDNGGKDRIQNAYQTFFFANAPPVFELVELDSIVSNDISKNIVEWLCMTDEDLSKQKTGSFSGEAYRAQLVRLLNEMTE